MIHPKQLLVLIACSAIAYTGRSQLTKRSLVAKAFNKKDSSSTLSHYEVHLLNPTDSIIYITHSYNILLVDGMLFDENSLSPISYERDTANYALYYAGRDTIRSVDGYYPKLATFLLPFQHINFRINISKSSRRNRLLLEYITLPDFCYRAAKKETQSGDNWVKKYKRQTLKIPLE